LQDPLVDAVRSLLDGHIVLARGLAAEAWYPPVDVLASISRLMPAVTAAEHRERAVAVRRMMSAYAQSEDLVRIGAYKPGSDAELDAALKARPGVRAFCVQGVQERQTFEESVRALAEIRL
jgi:flagellum-specific ATP synthase